MPPATLEELIAPQIEFEDGSSKGGNRGFTCVHCEKRFYGSQTRQIAHLIGIKGKGIAICKKIPVETSEELLEAYDGIQNVPGRGPSSGSRPASETGVYCSIILGYCLMEMLVISIMAMYDFNAGSVEDPPRKRYRQQDLGPMLQKATKAELDDAVADFFYGTGTPLHISRCVSSSASYMTSNTLPAASRFS